LARRGARRRISLAPFGKALDRKFLGIAAPVDEHARRGPDAVIRRDNLDIASHDFTDFHG
jgi:hypothetical protein